MWMFNIFTATIMLAAWVFFFFVFDEVILKGHFKRKLQKRFKVEE